ncbi:MAG: S9 family peptidase [Candidatus Heimdallarchaeota archaeon]|nr:MAG: S9 family peptidase [Candidatus Heimdallarchaeota archaeon]
MTASHLDDFKQYLAIETAGGPTWHPNNQEIAFVYDNPGLMQIFTVPIQSEHTFWPKRMIYNENRCTDPRYLQDGTIVFLKDNKGDENFQIGFITRDLDVEWITNDLSAKHLVTLTTTNSIYYSANITDKKIFSIYRHRIPLQTNNPERIYQPDEGLVKAEVVSPDEKFLVFARIHGNNYQELYLLEIETGKIDPLSRKISGDFKTRWTAVRWLDQNHILVLTDHESEFQRIAIISFDGKFHTINEIETNLQYESPSNTFTFCENSPYTYFSFNQDGYSIIVRAIFDSNGCSKYETLGLPHKAVLVTADERTFKQGLSLSPDGNLLALTLSSPTSPINIWILDLQSRKLWKATDASTVGLNPNNFVDTSLRIFSSFDRLEVPYFRYLPKGKVPNDRWPAIIIIHGGPEAQIRPNFSPVIQYFLSAGFAVVTPNIRGSTGYGRTYLDLDNIEKRLDSIRDIQYLVNDIHENDSLIDSNRLAIFGGSYGGFAVLSVMTEYPSLWKAGVDIFGIANFVTFLQNTAPWRRKLREIEYGSLDGDMDTLNRISPIHKVDQITAPLFIIAGDNDERVPLSESIQMYESLKERGLSVKLLRFADEGHGITKLKNKIQAYSEIISWLKEHV